MVRIFVLTTKMQCEFECEERGGVNSREDYGLIRELGLEQEIWKEKQEEKQKEKERVRAYKKTIACLQGWDFNEDTEIKFRGRDSSVP